MSGRIVSTTNPTVKWIKRLRSRKHRDTDGVFTIEGPREIHRALDSGVAFLRLLWSARHIDRAGNDVVDRASTEGIETVEVSDIAMEAISNRRHPAGVFAIAEQFDTSLDRLQPGKAPLILVVAGIEKPGNLGAMIRSAQAAGAHGVIAADGRTDVFNPSVVRASQGALFGIRVATTDSVSALQWLRDHDVVPIPARTDASRVLWDADLTGAVAPVVGAEDTGLGPPWSDIDTAVRIPMAPGVTDSLNASVAAALLLFEVARQRA